jgi:hypothetical protein
MRVAAAHCMVNEAEIVAFDDGREYLAGTSRLAGQR